VVWRGYAAGIFKNPNAANNYYRNVVRSIFDQYPLFASGYDPRGAGPQDSGR
jgi:hypothetical protein